MEITIKNPKIYILSLSPNCPYYKQRKNLPNFLYSYDNQSFWADFLAAESESIASLKRCQIWKTQTTKFFLPLNNVVKDDQHFMFVCLNKIDESTNHMLLGL